MKRLFLPFLACAAMLGLAACGGGGGVSGSSSSSSGGGGTATTGTLTYVNPTGYSNVFYQCALVQDPSSTSTTLVLDVIGPYQIPAVGLSFAFDVDTSQAVWSTSPVVTNGNLFTNGNVIAQGWVAGGRLQGLVTTKGMANQVKDASSGIIAKIALTAAPGAKAGTIIINDAGFGTLMDNSGPPATPVAFSIGTLTLN
jgi:hypothetical protein